MQHACIDLLLLLLVRVTELLHDFDELGNLGVNKVRLSREDTLEVLVSCIIYLFRILRWGEEGREELAELDHQLPNVVLGLRLDQRVVLVHLVREIFDGDAQLFLA